MHSAGNAKTLPVPFVRSPCPRTRSLSPALSPALLPALSHALSSAVSLSAGELSVGLSSCLVQLSCHPLPPPSLSLEQLTVSGCNSICQLPLEDLISCLHHHYHYHHHFHYAFYLPLTGARCDVSALFSFLLLLLLLHLLLRVQLLHVRRHFVSGLFSVSNAISLLVFIFPAVCHSPFASAAAAATACNPWGHPGLDCRKRRSKKT